MSHPLWDQLAADAGRTLAPEQSAALEQYLDLLTAGNEQMNLTRITDREQARVQHVADALTLLPFLPAGAHRLADVGSGGGVPGVPLAIARPDVRVTLIESIGKKAAFLEESAAALGLANVHVFNGRAEAWRGGRFEVVACRAVAALGKLVEWCRPLVAPGGVLLAMKGPRIAEELAEAAPVLRGQNARVETHPIRATALAGHVIAEIRWAGK